MKDIILSSDGLYSDEKGQYLFKKGFTAHLILLGHVCTARFIQSFPHSKEASEYELRWWIELLSLEGSPYTRKLKSSYITYKPQSLIAVTTVGQEGANEALLEVGFEPSRPVLNMKYGEGRELITWTFAIHGFKEEEKV